MVNKSVSSKAALVRVARRRHNRKAAPKSKTVRLAHRRHGTSLRVAGNGKRVVGRVSAVVLHAKRRAARNKIVRHVKPAAPAAKRVGRK